MKKIFAFLLSLMLAVSLLIGCAQNAKSVAASTVPSATASEKKEIVTLSLLMFTDWWNNSGWEDVVNDVNARAEELGYRVEVEKIAGGDQGNQIVKSRFASGETPDMLLYHNANSAVIDLGDSFMDISGKWTANYDQDMVNSKNCTINGKVVGVPANAVTLDGMYYNEKVFQDVGVEIPTNWDEFLVVCEKIKATGVTPVYFSGKDAWTLQLMPNDGFERAARDGKSMTEILEEINEGKSKYSDQTFFMDTMDKMLVLKSKGYINETYLSDTYDAAQTALVEGKAAMYSMASWLSTELEKKYPGKTDHIGAFPTPFEGDEKVPAWGSRAMLVPADCKHPEQAKAFVEYIGSKEGQQVFFTHMSGIPLMDGITSNASRAEQDLMNYAAERGKISIWSDLVKYNYGSFDKYCQDLLVGAKTSLQVAEEMDKETYKNAKAKGDTNFVD
ncbi:MAG: ABC transporter substrate-binding protein [Ruthenibacterium sp.]